jgi:hypothetical protein
VSQFSIGDETPQIAANPTARPYRARPITFGLDSEKASALGQTMVR